MPKERTVDEKDAPYGVAFLGRDSNKWGDEIGEVPIDPDICPSPNQCPSYIDRSVGPDDKIHLVIASFRDRLCPRTLFNLFSKAENPYRMFVRVLQQIESSSKLDDDGDCWENMCLHYNSAEFDCKKFRKNVEIVSVPASTAKGPTDARAKLSALILHDYVHANDGKHRLSPVAVTDYCMQTDSHMDFSDNYDTHLIEMFHRTENDRAVLSTYVDPMENNNKDPKTVPHLCMIQFTDTWRNWGTKFIKNALKPKLTNLVWGAGLSFHKCHAELNVPYDPFLDGVFDGEETNRGIRFFTHGYDVYTPDKVLVTHDYHGHQSNPNVHSWGRKNAVSGQDRDLLKDVDMSFMDEIEAVRPTVDPVSTRRVNLLFDLLPNAEPEKFEMITSSRYGLGKLRTLDQAYEFAGFDRKTHEMVGHNRCGNLKWVPYEAPVLVDWGVEETLSRKLWNEEHVALGIRAGSGAMGFDPLTMGLIGVSLVPIGFVLRKRGWFRKRKTAKSLQ
jgi:Glycosyltransferase (GlcNAc)